MFIGLGIGLGMIRRVAGAIAALARFDSTTRTMDASSPTMDQDEEPALPAGPSLSGAFADGVQGVAYSDSIPISGGTGPYTLEIISGTVPDGYTLEVVGSDIVLSGSDPN